MAEGTSGGSTRRGLLLAGLGAVVVGGLVWWRLPGWLATPDRAPRLRAALARHVAAPPALPSGAAIPAERAAELIVQGIAADEIGVVVDDPVRLRAQLAARIRSDLAGGRTRFVDGWLMAETEVAVASLTGRGAAS